MSIRFRLLLGRQDPVGPDEDTASADGWIRYPSGHASALMCDGSVRTFARGGIRARNIWRAFND